MSQGAKQYKFIRKLAKIVGLFFIFCWLAQTLIASSLLLKSSKGVSFQLEIIADGLGVPWGMTFLGTDQILFTEINIYNPNYGLLANILLSTELKESEKFVFENRCTSISSMVEKI